MRSSQEDLESPLLEKHPSLDDDHEKELPTHLLDTANKKESLLATLLPSATYRPRNRLYRFLYALLPSFLKPATKSPPKHGIAALDGLRGLACLFVFNEHYVILYQSKNSQHWINRVPFIRIWYHGKGAVYLFFVISGYVLSYKSLKQIRAKEYSGLMRTMSSSILRRGFRLYLPCLIASFIIMVLTWFNAYEYPYALWEHYSQFLFWKEAPPGNGQLLLVYWNNVRFIFCATFPFNIALGEFDYAEFDPHQWSIPVEFRGSMALFVVVIGIARMKTVWRLVSEVVVFWYLYDTGRVHVSLFFMGLILGEVDLLRKAYSDDCGQKLSGCKSIGGGSNGVLMRMMQLSDKTCTMLWMAVFITGYFMMSSVREAQNLGNWLPRQLDGWAADPDVFLLTYGSTMVVWAVANSAALGVVFNSALVQYLGNISYALYLVHGTTVRWIGYLWVPVSFRIATATGPGTELNAEWWATVSNLEATVAYLLGMAVVGTATFWYADLFWGWVDVPVVKFARWVEGRLTEGADEGQK